MQQALWLQLKHVLGEKRSFQGLALKRVSAQLSVCRFQIFSVSRGGITASKFFFFLFLLLFYVSGALKVHKKFHILTHKKTKPR